MTEFTLAELVVRLQSKCIVELGTGDGATASSIMKVLHRGAILTTINWPNPPSGDDPLKHLLHWAGDPRLEIVCGDTREQAWRFDNHTIDLLYIDSTHTCECATQELAAYRPKLRDGATVVVDDLDHNDMRTFWDKLPYTKVEYNGGRVGVLHYREGR